jgi:hypothetical protein
MANFDSPNREVCSVFEGRTNTPLQALNLMNDVAFLEASRKLAERMIAEGGSSPAQRINYGYELLLGRPVSDRQREVLLKTLSHFESTYQQNAGAAVDYVSQGESPRRAGIHNAHLAAYTAVASLILNLDEAVTKH